MNLIKKIKEKRAQASFEYFILFTTVSLAVIVSSFLYFTRESDGQIHARGQLRNVAEDYFSAMVTQILQ